MGKEKVQEFPDVSTKLGAPTKKSLFERQKAEAEAKRLKEQQETAAVYEDFVKSFDDEGDDERNTSARPTIPSSNTGIPGGFSKRHFTGPSGRGGRVSGPGSLGPPTSSLLKKRTHDGAPAPRDNSRGLFSFGEGQSAKSAFQASDDEDEADGPASRAQEKAAHRPTLHLSSLPPGTSPAAVKAIIPDNIKVEGVRVIQASNTLSNDRRAQSVIVTLAAETPAGDIDAAVSALQNKYLGYGFYLNLSRHLSSAVTGTNLPNTGNSTTLPFGAKPAQLPAGRGAGFTRGQRGGFAPPPSYGAGSFNRAPPVHVAVNPPSDLKQLKLIHKTIESLVSHGPEFEALLMSRPEVQKEEKWAWLWDSTSTGGVWYRWRLWDILTNAKGRQQRSQRGANDGKSQIVFDSGAPWTAPERVLPFEYSIAVEEFVSDDDYNSSSDEDSGDEGRRRLTQLQGGGPIPGAGAAELEDEASYLNPLHKAKLVHLLSRLPDTTAKLRRGDVARVTAFAIQHAGEGAEEVVSLLVQNVRSPLSLMAVAASPQPQDRHDTDSTNRGDNDNDAKNTPPVDVTTSGTNDTDPSQHKLIALYIISDILSSSSTSGVRHAWRYRQLFEQNFRAQHTFSHLGRVEKDLRWGRLRAEKWRRSVGAVLGLWEGWCVFPAKAQEEFSAEFQDPVGDDEDREKEERERKDREKSKGKWKSVQERNMEEAATEEKGMDVDGETMAEDVDGEPMDEDLDGEPMEEEDMDGEPMAEDEGNGDDLETGKNEQVQTEQDNDKQGQEDTDMSAPKEVDAAAARRRRPRAEDMFADSDEE